MRMQMKSKTQEIYCRLFSNFSTNSAKFIPISLEKSRKCTFRLSGTHCRPKIMVKIVRTYDVVALQHNSSSNFTLILQKLTNPIHRWNSANLEGELFRRYLYLWCANGKESVTEAEGRVLSLQKNWILCTTLAQIKNTPLPLPIQARRAICWWKYESIRISTLHEQMNTTIYHLSDNRILYYFSLYIYIIISESFGWTIEN